MEEEFPIELCVYNNAAVGKELPCEREPRKTRDRYAVATCTSRGHHDGELSPLIARAHDDIIIIAVEVQF